MLLRKTLTQSSMGYVVLQLIIGYFTILETKLSNPPFTPNTPIILVPGDGGSQLEAKLNKTKAPHLICDLKTVDYFSLWLNLELLFPIFIDCWVDNMKLIYDNQTRTTRNNHGVSIRVPGFGDTATVEYLDPSKLPFSSYFAQLVDHLVDNYGYKRGHSIRGAPYDFRKAPNELQDYFVAMEKLIINTYNENGQNKPIIICHSMGCLLMLKFFNEKSQDWKDKYINSFVTLSGPWGGAVKSIKAFISGDNFGVIMAQSLTIRADERTFPSLAYLLPNDNVFDSDRVIVETKTKKYSISNYEELFNDIDYRVGYEMWTDVKNITWKLEAPGVEVYCIHGNGSETISKLIYNENKFPDDNPDKIEYGNGDGTVNIESLSACNRWRYQQKQPVHYLPKNNFDHMKVLYDQQIIKHVEYAARLNGKKRNTLF